MPTIEELELKLKRYRKELDSVSQELTKGEGASQVLLERLKTEFGISTLEVAKKELSARKNRLDSIGEEIELAVSELEKSYKKAEQR